MAAGIYNASLTLPSGSTTAGEHPWTTRILHYHPGTVVPRRMYSASCTTGGAARLFVSVNLTDSSQKVHGAVFETKLDATGKLLPTGVQREFPECLEVHGIAAKSDCSTVAVLCRRPSGTSTKDKPTKDMVATLANATARDWLTQPASADGKTTNDEEWLYEWTDGNILHTPGRYVAHKAIGSWEEGNQYLSYGQADDTYGLSLKSTVYGPNKIDRHEADAFLVVRRSDHAIALERGWYWACASGHTLFNHPAYNPATKKYAVMCATDLGTDPANAGGYSGMWMRPEGKQAKGFHSVPLWQSLSVDGGPVSLQPLPDGGYLGVIAGVNGSAAADVDFRNSGPATSIGLARFNANGALVGGVKWVVGKPGAFFSYPQLAPLGNGAFLLGYGEMATLAEQMQAKAANQNIDDAFRIPKAFYLMEIDQDGKVLKQAQKLNGAGWGEQDQMVALGTGRVGWAYIPNPARTGSTNPSYLSRQLQLSVYAKN